MKEARIIFPVGILGKPLYHAMQTSINQINLFFNGCTTLSGIGYWKNTESIIEQAPVHICDIAYEQNTANDMQLFEIAMKFRKDAEQKEVYLRYGNGHVQMVNEHSIMDNGRPNCWYSPDFAGVVDAVNSLADIEQTPGTRIAAFEFLFKTMHDGGKGHHVAKLPLGGELRGEEWGTNVKS